MRRFSTTRLLADVLVERARAQARAVDLVFERILRIDDALVAGGRRSCATSSRAEQPFARSVLAHDGSFAALRRYISASSRSASSIAASPSSVSRIIASRFAALVSELQQHGQRLVGEIGHRRRRAARRVLDQQELRDLPLELGDDVARLLLTDSRQASSRRRSRRGRSRRRSSTSAARRRAPPSADRSMRR